MKDKELIKFYKQLQETILKEETEKYAEQKANFEDEKAEFKVGKYLIYKVLDEIYFNDYNRTPAGLIEMGNYANGKLAEYKESGQYRFIECKIDKETKTCDYGEEFRVFNGLKICGYILRPEDTIKSEAKSRFISEFSTAVQKRAKEIEPNSNYFWTKTVDCFLMESFLNGEISFDFVAMATYSLCKS